MSFGGLLCRQALFNLTARVLLLLLRGLEISQVLMVTRRHFGQGISRGNEREEEEEEFLGKSNL